MHGTHPPRPQNLSYDLHISTLSQSAGLKHVLCSNVTVVQSCKICRVPRGDLTTQEGGGGHAMSPVRGPPPAAPSGPAATYTFLFCTTPSRTKAARAFFCTSEDNTS